MLVSARKTPAHNLHTGDMLPLDGNFFLVRFCNLCCFDSQHVLLEVIVIDHLELVVDHVLGGEPHTVYPSTLRLASVSVLETVDDYALTASEVQDLLTFGHFEDKRKAAVDNLCPHFVVHTNSLDEIPRCREERLARCCTAVDFKLELEFVDALPRIVYLIKIARNLHNCLF